MKAESSIACKSSAGNIDVNRSQTASTQVQGLCLPEFAPVRREFERNFTERNELGAACSVYLHGRKVVDLWGGTRSDNSPWQEDTLALTFSVTKGMAAAALVLAYDRGWFELDAPVACYWPEFGVAGKESITVRQLLAHQAGLIGVSEHLKVETLADYDRLAEVLAKQAPAWAPGTRHGYHTLTLGWYQNEFLRRVDPRRRTLGTFFQEEIARPLGLEYYIGLPDEVDRERLAAIKGFHRFELLAHLDELPVGMVLAGIWPRSLVARSVRNLRLNNPAEIGGPKYRAVEIPSANGIGRAAAVAQLYSVLASGGAEFGMRDSTWRALIEPAKAPPLGTRDAILKLDTRYSFGFSRPSRSMQFGNSVTSFGCPGAGGSFGMGDPDHGLGFCYVTRKMGFRIFDDPREQAVRSACYQSLAALAGQSRVA